MKRNLANQSIAVVGYGITGRACVRFLLSQHAKVCVLDAAPDIAQKVSEEIHLSAGVTTGLFDKHIDLSSFSLVVLSPGINPHQACFDAFRKQGGLLIGDIELFAWFNKTPLIGITGSNGKTTVTDMLGKVLSSAGLQVELAGNYGKCAVDLLLENDTRSAPLDIVVLELSSYQLEMTESLQLDYATILNITEDHLDRHGSFEAYKLAKQRIFKMAKNIIACRDETTSYPPTDFCNSPNICAEVGTKTCETGYSMSQGNKATINVDGEALFAVSDITLKGTHNYINTMIVLAICDQLSLDRKQSIPAICQYQGLAHRFETIKISQHKFDTSSEIITNVTWINDSKATNVGACMAALACFATTHEYLVLIAGGDAKGVELFPLQQPIKQRVNALIVFGKDAAKFLELIPTAILVQDLNEAISTALSLLQKNTLTSATVMLSPACASLDMFSNYQARGEAFTQAVIEQVA